MQSTVFTAIFLPLVLASIMFGMGLSLQLKDFARLAKLPKPIFVGLFGQMLLLPALAFAIALAFNASAQIAIGMMLLAACPGGSTSNLLSHLAKANLALSISLTAITTVICVFTTPFLIAFSINYFSEGEPVEFSLLKTSLGLIVITLVPVALGMLTRHRFINIALRLEPIFRKLAIVFMLLLIVKISFDEREMLVEGFPDLYLFTIGLNLSATLLGMLLAKLFLLNQKDRITLGIEVGTQNATLAILIAVSFIQEPAYALIAGGYGLMMYLGAAGLVLYSRNKGVKE
ncbi:bile acid:Na+ symporter, BASS family [Glaciecola punicea ACAM 611]|jgi:BASS family bile acid:Na+ symporter|uniref:Bile acid:Na+ symporter, BASS family n=1 Tax=Glaciecola punicea ACAM 611 TaxID=1121923 RepID=H5TB00_9ALTE|nr:bile acid:sodium symporter family protein [Glaciecola punicea]OFA32496.1 bile acid:sodium symporter [Glaciecola punicea]GAB55477.1 bile acid:Na+ symporter, BASS family [Glaciecola punicea ACAM 611]